MARRGPVAYTLNLRKQEAVKFVLMYLFNPVGVLESDWERPTWVTRGWFNQILGRSDGQPVRYEDDPDGMDEDDEPEEPAEGEYEVLKYEVVFYLEKRKVCVITFEGERDLPTSAEPDPPISWFISRVRYRRSWGVGPDGSQEWIDRQLDADSPEQPSRAELSPGAHLNGADLSTAQIERGAAILRSYSNRLDWRPGEGLLAAHMVLTVEEIRIGGTRISPAKARADAEAIRVWAESVGLDVSQITISQADGQMPYMAVPTEYFRSTVLPLLEAL